MPGVLHVIGTGPGDPELITVKAVRTLKEVGVICVPKGRVDGGSLALSIAEKAVPLEGKEILEIHFPMKKTGSVPDPELETRWDEAAGMILERLNSGRDVAFLTLGDPTLYSTFFHLHERLLRLSPGLKMVLIPGISSVNASAAAAVTSLGLADDRVAILPATYVDDIRETLRMFDTVVLMKVHRVIEDLLRVLEEMGLLERAVCISRTGMNGERVFTDLKGLKAGDVDYFTTIIVKRGRRAGGGIQV